jgi:hypothetical protein
MEDDLPDETVTPAIYLKLDDGTIVVGFCSNEKCNVLGCPGDCLDSEDPVEEDQNGK